MYSLESCHYKQLTIPGLQVDGKSLHEARPKRLEHSHQPKSDKNNHSLGTNHQEISPIKLPQYQPLVPELHTQLQGSPVYVAPEQIVG